MQFQMLHYKLISLATNVLNCETNDFGDDQADFSAFSRRFKYSLGTTPNCFLKHLEK